IAPPPALAQPETRADRGQTLPTIGLDLPLNPRLNPLPAFPPESLDWLMTQTPPSASSDLFLAYPPENHQTSADRIFLIGTADPRQPVTVNGTAIGDRSPAGHFAPSFPLQIGANTFTLRQGDQTLTLTITRLDSQPQIPQTLAFGEESLTPAVPIARQAGEWVCFGAIAPPAATVEVLLGSLTIPLMEQSQQVTLPSNLAVLIGDNAPQIAAGSGQYQGCTPLNLPSGTTLQPQFRLTHQGQTLTTAAPGTLEVLAPAPLLQATVTSPSGTARTGPSTNYSRLTPLPPGTQASITGREGEWVRLDYGDGKNAWIKASEVEETAVAALPEAIIRSALSQTLADRTEIRFPLTRPVPVSLTEDGDRLSLTLHTTTAQTDTVYISPDPILASFHWQQPQPQTVTYTFRLTTPHAWGHTLRYEGSTLILTLKHPPQNRGLQGVHIFLDPGHGSENDLGARGPNDYPEKDVALKVSLMLQRELEARGARVSLSRTGDEDLWPNDRVALMEQADPQIALSLHYNALPDAGDALGTQGIGAFWYHPQAQDLAQFLHDGLVQRLDRPSYGVFWNNLALTRPSMAPSVLLELGFMINPEEFEWITNDQAQGELVRALADSLETWLQQP
ncbi:MAG: N-acetylmuramoyl-L-alanine amidase, partial [Prochlorothrix sp.]